MITSQLSRVLSALPTFLESQTSSYNRHGSTSTASNSYDGYVSVNGDVSVTVSNGTNFFTASQITNSHTYNQSQGGAFGYTTSANATKSETSFFSSSFGSYSSQQEVGTDGSTTTTSDSSSSSSNGADSTTYNLSDTIVISTLTTTEYPKITSTNTTTTSTHYLVSGSNLTTATTTADVLTSTFTSETSTFESFTTTATTYGNYIEWGVALTADSEWLWVLTASLTSPNFLTDIASSVGATTFWPEAVNVPLSFAVATVADDTNTIEVSPNTTAFTYENVIYTQTIPTTLTSGANFIRDTYTTGVYSADTTSDTTTYGIDGATLTAISTASYETTTMMPLTAVYKNLYNEGMYDQSTSSFNGLYYAFTTTSSYSVVPAVLLASAGGTTFASDDIAHSAMGNTVAGTNISYKNVEFIPFGEPASNLTPVAPVGAFVAPADLGSAGNPYAFGSNLSFQGMQIPYGETRSVFSNAVTPFPVAFSAVGTNSHTYSYSWTSDTLKVTEQSTALAGTSTVTHSTTTEGTFSTEGGSSQFFKGGGSVFGGFQPIESASETVTFYPRAVLGTSISENGSSTTYRTLVTSFENSTLQGTAVVETPVPAYRIWTFLGGPSDGDLPYLVYARN